MSYLVGASPFDALEEGLKAEASWGVDALSQNIKQAIDPGAKQREQDRVNAENDQKKREAEAKQRAAAGTGMPSIAGIPLPVLLIGGAAAAFFLTRK